MRQWTDGRLRVAKWRAIAQFAGADAAQALKSALTTPEMLRSLLVAMLDDRFASTEVLAAIAACLVRVARAVEAPQNWLVVSVDDLSNGFLDLCKQSYVTFGEPSIRHDIVQVVVDALTSKTDAKIVLRSQLLRSVVQSAVATGTNLQMLVRRDPVVNSITLLRRMVELLCDGNLADDNADIEPNDEVFVLCSLIVRLMLSRVAIAFEEAIRLLQMLVEESTARQTLIRVVDLRGALEKAHWFAELKPGGLSQDPYLAMLCAQQYEQLIPEIDDYERQYGILVGLPTDPESCATPETALKVASQWKVRGNWFFRRANFPAARAFYRHAILTLRTTRALEEQQLERLTRADVLAQCTIGASVQVRTMNASGEMTWKDAMVSDVGDAAHIEVVYDIVEDGEDDEEVVSIDRVRLQMRTNLLAAFDNLRVDCLMNMGKAFSALFDHEHAVESFSSVLAVQGNHVAALYFRGVSYMALHDLKGAQQDLYKAHTQCRQLKAAAAGSTQQREALAQAQSLLPQVVAAYKRLQQLHANKKKLDKKIIKQMVRYLSTIPGLQDGE